MTPELQAILNPYVESASIAGLTFAAEDTEVSPGRLRVLMTVTIPDGHVLKAGVSLLEGDASSAWLLESAAKMLLSGARDVARARGIVLAD